MKIDTIIIGGGLTGLSTAYHLRNKNFILLEKENTVGGICKSVKTDTGFTYDYTGHLLHIKNSYVKMLIHKLLRNNIDLKIRNSWIFSNSVFTQYPFQANLYGLPKKVINECIEGVIEAKLTNLPAGGQLSFYDWCLKTFGKGISKHFMIPYNRKLWKIDTRKLTTKWMGDYIPQPNLKEVIDGAFNSNKKMFGYNSTFYYPRKSGIQSLIDSIKKEIPDTKIKTNINIMSINIKSKIIKTNLGDMQYKNIVSTIPLPEIIKLIKNSPSKIRRLSGELDWVSLLNINIGINRKNVSDKHWVYFPENKYIFYRVGFYCNFSKTLCPQNTSSMYVEISYRNRKIDEQRLFQKTITDLNKIGILKATDRIISTCNLNIPYAYVIYNQKREFAFGAIQNYLTKNSIFSIGRYGGWKYSTMEDAILDGRAIVRCLK
ncbi:MAG: FAD-dependent oxidoreductase [Elusimicrobia bacterium]|nr:FAD-dependent oxidoreductase [Elusimicrobiota bacterium]